jgi:hypothetical protein
MKTAILLFISLCGLRSFAIEFQRTSFKQSEAECGHIDLRPLMGPVRSQGDIGWCYANAAADLLSFKFRDDLGGRPVSSTYVALTFNYPIRSSTAEGGAASVALNIAQLKGLCPQLIEDGIRMTGPQVSLKKRLNGLLYLKEHYDSTDGTSLEEDLANYYTVNRSILTQIPREDLRDLLDHSSSRSFIAHFAEYLCRGHKVFPRHKAIAVARTKYSLGGQTWPLIRILHRQMDKQQPAAINYFADLFDADNAKKLQSSRHTSVIVGRDWNEHTHQCEFLIRNSWGPYCHQYKAASLKDRCEAGNVWVSEKVLSNYIYGTVYYE